MPPSPAKPALSATPGFLGTRGGWQGSEKHIPLVSVPVLISVRLAHDEMKLFTRKEGLSWGRPLCRVMEMETLRLSPPPSHG